MTRPRPRKFPPAPEPEPGPTVWTHVVYGLVIVVILAVLVTGFAGGFR